jgi:hypothetical protein
LFLTPFYSGIENYISPVATISKRHANASGSEVLDWKSKDVSSTPIELKSNPSLKCLPDDEAVRELAGRFVKIPLNPPL